VKRKDALEVLHSLDFFASLELVLSLSKQQAKKEEKDNTFPF
jgi:hypothetical protein